MKRCLPFLLILLACGGESAPPKAPVKNTVDMDRPLPFVPQRPTVSAASVDESKICSSSDECVLVPTPCGDHIAMNKYEMEKSLGMLSTGECGWREHIKQEQTAQCHANMCRASSNIKACESEVDCVVVAGSCNVLAVVSSGSAEQLSSAIAQSNANKRCAQPSYPPMAVGCLGGQCVGVKKEQAELRAGCQSETDCALVRGLCGQPMAVNKKHKERTEAYFAKKNKAVTCPSGSSPETRVRCDNNYCVAAVASP